MDCSDPLKLHHLVFLSLLPFHSKHSDFPPPYKSAAAALRFSQFFLKHKSQGNKEFYAILNPLKNQNCNLNQWVSFFSHARASNYCVP